jgi:hypothetical protein
MPWFSKPIVAVAPGTTGPDALVPVIGVARALPASSAAAARINFIILVDSLVLNVCGFTLMV